MITTEIIAFATANELCVAFSSQPVSPGRNVSKSIGGAGTVEYSSIIQGGDGPPIMTQFANCGKN